MLFARLEFKFQKLDRRLDYALVSNASPGNFDLSACVRHTYTGRDSRAHSTRDGHATAARTRNNRPDLTLLDRLLDTT